MDSLAEPKCPRITSPERHSTTFLHTNGGSVGCEAYCDSVGYLNTMFAI